MSHTYNTDLLKSETIANNIMAFFLRRPDGFTYRAGQTVDLEITSAEGNKLTHTFSLVSAPEEEHLIVATRIRDSEYKKTLQGLLPGAEVTIDGPYGSFFLHQDASKPAVFLVGGIGITPFISMIHEVISTSHTRKIFLFYSNRQPADSAYLEELTSVSERNSETLSFIPTMTDATDGATSWTGETGYINWDMVTKYVTGPENAVFYTAGPSAMVNAMRTMLTEHDISEDAIRTEEFPGY